MNNKQLRKRPAKSIFYKNRFGFFAALFCVVWLTENTEKEWESLSFQQITAAINIYFHIILSRQYKYSFVFWAVSLLFIIIIMIFSSVSNLFDICFFLWRISFYWIFSLTVYSSVTHLEITIGIDSKSASFNDAASGGGSIWLNEIVNYNTCSNTLCLGLHLFSSFSSEHTHTYNIESIFMLFWWKSARLCFLPFSCSFSYCFAYLN